MLKVKRILLVLCGALLVTSSIFANPIGGSYYGVGNNPASKSGNKAPINQYLKCQVNTANGQVTALVVSKSDCTKLNGKVVKLY